MRDPIRDEALKFRGTVAPKTYPQMTRDQIESLIANGNQIIIFNGYALKVNTWIPFHPGGEKAILHMVGRDATDEINAFVHLYTSPRVDSNPFAIGCIPYLLHFRWLDIVSARSPRHG